MPRHHSELRLDGWGVASVGTRVSGLSSFLVCHVPISSDNSSPGCGYDSYGVVGWEGEWCPQTFQVTVSTSVKCVDRAASSNVWGPAHVQSSSLLTRETLAITWDHTRPQQVLRYSLWGFQGGVGDCPSADHQKCHIQTKIYHWLPECVYASDPYCSIRRGCSVLNK